jgi:LmbE family N-acetylglucosaminyl deacetylase
MVVALKYHQRTFSGRKSGFPPKNMVVTSKGPPGTVLILAPHPDDEVIGPGGVLNMHLQQQDAVTVLYLTDGRGGNAADTSLVAVRRQEANSIGSTFGFKQIFWDIPDTTLNDAPELVTKLINVLKEIRPHFIYLTSFFDRQYDHFGTNQLLVEALKGWKSSAVTILGYEVWDNISYPNFVVDITNHFGKKAEMMVMYKTPMKATDFVALCRHRNALNYSLYVNSIRQEQEGYAEAYYRLDSEQFVNLFEFYKTSLTDNYSNLAHATAPKLDTLFLRK